VGEVVATGGDETTTVVVVAPTSIIAEVPLSCEPRRRMRLRAKGIRSTATGLSPASCTAFTLPSTASLSAATRSPLMTGPLASTPSLIG
jgi:hypothetical protein